jgi:hypothetical protein
VRLGNVGARLDLFLKQGATYLQPLLFTVDGRPESAPMDLSSGVLRAQLRSSSAQREAAPAAVFQCIPIIGFARFNVLLYLPYQAAELIPAGKSPLDRLSQYEWDLEFFVSTMFVIPAAYGAVRVHPEVTR